MGYVQNELQPCGTRFGKGLRGLRAELTHRHQGLGRAETLRLACKDGHGVIAMASISITIVS